MKLCEMCNCNNKREIFGVSADSREIKENFLFDSLKDESFIEEEIKNGACALMVSKTSPQESRPSIW